MSSNPSGNSSLLLSEDDLMPKAVPVSPIQDVGRISWHPQNAGIQSNSQGHLLHLGIQSGTAQPLIPGHGVFVSHPAQSLSSNNPSLQFQSGYILQPMPSESTVDVPQPFHGANISNASLSPMSSFPSQTVSKSPTSSPSQPFSQIPIAPKPFTQKYIPSLQFVGNKVAIPRHGTRQCSSATAVPFYQQTTVPILVSTTAPYQNINFPQSQQYSSHFHTQIQTQSQPEVKLPVFDNTLQLGGQALAFSGMSLQSSGQGMVPIMTPISPIQANFGAPFSQTMCNLLVVQSLGSGIPSSGISTLQSFPSQVMGTSQVTVCSSQPKVFQGIPTSRVHIDNRGKKENEIIHEDVNDEVSKLLQEVSATVVNLVEISSKLDANAGKEVLIMNGTSNGLEVPIQSEDIDDSWKQIEEKLETCSDTKCLSNDNQDVQVSSSKDLCDYNSPMSIENFHEMFLNLRMKKKEERVEDESNSMDSFVPMSMESEFLSSINSESGRSDTEQSLGVRDETSMDVILEYPEAKPNNQEDEKDEPDFIWEEYLQQIGSSAVPPSAFKHVEHSLESGFVKGMKLEVRLKDTQGETEAFWVASVLMTCGPLLRLRYEGYPGEGVGEFWCDRTNSEVHPLGWCAENGKTLQPPEDIRDTVVDWHEFMKETLTGAQTAPAYLLNKKGSCSPIDQLRAGMQLEMQDMLCPCEVWVVQILENVGGRLYLRLEGTESASHHFWLFYLNPRLHPIGWAAQKGYKYQPPADIHDEKTEEDWLEILQMATKEAETDPLPGDIFKNQIEPKPHQFAVGMKLEALVPGANGISPATVVKVVNNLYFVIEIDDVRGPAERESIQLSCHSEYLGIFPVSWCQCKGIRLMPPPGWYYGDFVWGEYLTRCGAKAAPEKLFNSGTDEHEFERGMKLEAVNPANDNQICAATITKIVGPLLWIHLDHLRDVPSHIEDIDSHNLFPVGWCESNNYVLKPPIKAKRCQRMPSDYRTEAVYRAVTLSHGAEDIGPWCPKLYFNHRCFSGPYLSKGRIADLPCSIGPGPMDLVLKAVLSQLINVAYKSSKALKEIQLEGAPNPNMTQQVLKAKYKGKVHSGVVETCQREDQLEEYCRNVCIKLECCPYIISPLHVLENCPENCQQMTKTKYNYSYGNKKKRLGPLHFAPRPAIKSSSQRNLLKKGRKRKSFLLTQKKGRRQGSTRGGYIPVGQRDRELDEGFIDGADEEYDYPRHKRKHPHHVSHYEIQARRAKMPKYSFERKTHRKIYTSPNPKHHFIAERVPPTPCTGQSTEVLQFIKTTDCSHLARILKEQEVDGQAFLLLDLPTVQEHLELKLGPAVKLCHQIERLKVAFYENYA
ncbi:hypothetical protein DPMN_016623 [Dreissena polymorpha]|uniref:SLED domain-containing protein n=1 Tax=Dreissena polymorpha TaxID=45954 RepID=A0A9D4NBL3_DREPO|nr:hypothetical protein DPMN_016623 [Dreissena polymorpha]